MSRQLCVATFDELRLPLATSAAVFAGLFHLVGDHPQRGDLPITDDDLPAIEGLMETYRDRPMDFADATLVHLARREDLTTVFTIDHDDFETLRIGGRRHFLIVPGR